MKLLAIVTTVVLLAGFVYLYAFVKPRERRLIRQGILPRPEETTMADIVRLKNDPEHNEWALIRLMQMPEYKNLPHDELKKILDRL